MSINWSACLGHGSYGDTYKAECDFLPCAAKLLEEHPEINTITAKLKEKRLLLNNIKHPNIIQYFDIVFDPEYVSSAPVLLMELLDESLTQMLQHLQLPTPLQLDICHDIALAVAYLHSEEIIHRNLCSNNVLLIAGTKAKVADFVMFGVYATNGADVIPILTSVNERPRSLDYMPPEALTDPPRYTKKLDCYSEGVLMMQACTQLPEPRREERRKHIEQIDPGHPLLPLIKKCLSDQEDDRPSAADLCDRLSKLKKKCIREHSTNSSNFMGDKTPDQLRHAAARSWYTGSSGIRMVRGAIALDGDMAYFMNGKGEIWLYDSTDRLPWSKVNDSHRSRQYSSLAIVNGLLTVIGGLVDKGLANIVSNTLLSLIGDDVDTKEWKEYFPPMSTARYFAAAVTTSQHLIVAGGIGNERLSQFLPKRSTKDVNLSNVEVMNTDTLVWSTVASLPHPYCKISATVCEDKLYLLGGEDTKAKTCSVLACPVTKLVKSNRDSDGVWKKLRNNAPNYYCTGANLDGNLIVVGGEAQSGKKTTVKNEVYEYSPDRGTWKLITNVPTARYNCLVATFPSKKIVVVVGGCEEKKLCTATEIWQYA